MAEESEESRPRARTVFEVVEERHGGHSETTEGETLIVETPLIYRLGLVKLAANREWDRFAALTGVLATHIMTNAVIWPVLMVSLKAIVGAVLLSTNSLVPFTWFQAMLLSGGFALAGPVCFFLYRYWSGKY